MIDARLENAEIARLVGSLGGDLANRVAAQSRPGVLLVPVDDGAAGEHLAGRFGGMPRVCEQWPRWHSPEGEMPLDYLLSVDLAAVAAGHDLDLPGEGVLDVYLADLDGVTFSAGPEAEQQAGLRVLVRDACPADTEPTTVASPFGPGIGSATEWEGLDVIAVACSTIPDPVSIAAEDRTLARPDEEAVGAAYAALMGHVATLLPEAAVVAMEPLPWAGEPDPLIQLGGHARPTQADHDEAARLALGADAHPEHLLTVDSAAGWDGPALGLSAGTVVLTRAAGQTFIAWDPDE